MKKGIQNNSSFGALWQRVILDGRIYKLAREFRKKIEMPENGFDLSDSQYKFNIWHKKFKKKNKSSLPELSITNFIEKAKEIIPYRGIITDSSFDYLMMNFLIFDKVKDDDLNSLNNSGMDISIIKDGKSLSLYGMEHAGKEYGKKVENGVYLKIAPFSTIDKILKYIENKKTLIKKSLKIYTENIKLEKPRRFKTSSHFNRDFMILKVDDMFSKKEIEEKFNIKADYKDIAIARLIDAKVEKGVTPSIVKAVKQRRKIK